MPSKKWIELKLLLFIDGSVDTESKVGFGAYLLVADTALSLEQLNSQIEVQRFEQTSSSKLELQTLIWALSELEASECKLTVYSDSQNLIGLPARRERLKANDFRSKQNRKLNNSQLYEVFYRLIDQQNCQFVKVRGHQTTKQKSLIDQVFTLVDRASRKALRENIKSQPGRQRTLYSPQFNDF